MASIHPEGTDQSVGSERGLCPWDMTDDSTTYIAVQFRSSGSLCRPRSLFNMSNYTSMLLDEDLIKTQTGFEARATDDETRKDKSAAGRDEVCGLEVSRCLRSPRVSLP